MNKYMPSGFTPASTDANGKCRDTRCGNGQSVYDAVREGVADGWYPPTALVGPSVGGLPQPDNAIARVTVRQNEQFYIIVPAADDEQ